MPLIKLYDLKILYICFNENSKFTNFNEEGHVKFN